MEMLTKASANRSLSRQTVIRYRDEMISDNWQLTYETIKFDGDGRLFDGQHRLAACVEANVPFTTYVVYGADPSATTSLDTGRRRTNGDFLGIKGIRHGTAKSAIAKFLRDLLLIEDGKCSIPSFGKRQLPQKELLTFVSQNGPLLEEAISYVFSGSGNNLLQSPSVFGALFLRFSMVLPVHTKDFYETLLNSAGSKSGYHDNFYTDGHWDRNPIFALRIVLEEMEERKHSSHTKGRVRPEALVNVTIRAWNAWIEGETLTPNELLSSVREAWPEIKISGARAPAKVQETHVTMEIPKDRPKRRIVGAAAAAQAAAKLKGSRSGL